jgi:hypothetical protein
MLQPGRTQSVIHFAEGVNALYHLSDPRRRSVNPPGPYATGTIMTAPRR